MLFVGIIAVLSLAFELLYSTKLLSILRLVVFLGGSGDKFFSNSSLDYLISSFFSSLSFNSSYLRWVICANSFSILFILEMSIIAIFFCLLIF